MLIENIKFEIDSFHLNAVADHKGVKVQSSGRLVVVRRAFVRDAHGTVTILWLRRGRAILEYMQRKTVHTTLPEPRFDRHIDRPSGKGFWEKTSRPRDSVALLLPSN